MTPDPIPEKPTLADLIRRQDQFHLCVEEKLDSFAEKTTAVLKVIADEVKANTVNIADNRAKTLNLDHVERHRARGVEMELRGGIELVCKDVKAMAIATGAQFEAAQEWRTKTARALARDRAGQSVFKVWTRRAFNAATTEMASVKTDIADVKEALGAGSGRKTIAALSQKSLFTYAGAIVAAIVGGPTLIREVGAFIHAAAIFFHSVGAIAR